MRRWVHALTVAAALLWALLPLSAQQSTAVTGGLNGTVIDSTHAVVSGAKITVSGPQGTRVVTTDSLGHFSLSGLVPGFYDVTAERDGFQTVKSTHNEVVVGGSSLLNITLPVGSVEQTVQVSAGKVAVMLVCISQAPVVLFLVAVE